MKQYNYLARRGDDFIGGAIYARSSDEALHNARYEVKERKGDIKSVAIL